jgi:hypothetical protein
VRPHASDAEVWVKLTRWPRSALGRINFGSLDDSTEEPGYLTGIFQVQDPIANRRIMGIARVNLPQKSVDFFALGPAIGISFTLALSANGATAFIPRLVRYEFWSFSYSLCICIATLSVNRSESHSMILGSSVLTIDYFDYQVTPETRIAQTDVASKTRTPP